MSEKVLSTIEARRLAKNIKALTGLNVILFDQVHSLTEGADPSPYHDYTLRVWRSRVCEKCKWIDHRAAASQCLGCGAAL